MPQSDLLDAIEERLSARAFLFENPADYRNGVADVTAALREEALDIARALVPGEASSA